MLLLISAVNLGLVLALLALGVYVSFRIFHFADITADGSFTLGGATTTAIVMGWSTITSTIAMYISSDLANLMAGWSPIVSTIAGFLAGMLAGLTTAILHTRFNIHGLLSGILVMTALYSINLRVLGRSNVPLSESATLTKAWANLVQGFLGGGERYQILGWNVGTQEIANLFLLTMLVIVFGAALFVFLQTNLGAAMRAAGDNDQMIRALGSSNKVLLTLGLALANGLVALSGSLLAQIQEFADVQMGIGMVVWGLASVIIGESLVGSSRFGLLIAGTIIGSVLFRMMIAIALRCGLNPNDLKLITAIFVLLALVAPRWGQSLKRKRTIQASTELENAEVI